jgi:AraC family transcriptional regulator, positive regulator of tynA and feaB
MNGSRAQADGARGVFSLDTRIRPATGGDSSVQADFAAFQHGWEAQIGGGFLLPGFSAATTSEFRVKIRAARMEDAAITDVLGASAIRTAGPLGDMEEQVRLLVVEHGAWTIGGLPDHGKHTVQTGQFLLRHAQRPSHFDTVPHTIARMVFLPAAMLKPLLGNRIIVGPADSAEVRLLMAHANMIHETVADLSPAGAQAARAAMVELAKAVAAGRFDDAEPQLVPVLAQAAKDLANRRLADPELSPAALAGELNISVRTLQRAFAVTGESVAAYIRRRRLAEARRALAVPSGRLSVSELAAYWQFSDSSHFIRAFKSHYGQTPAEYARMAASAANLQ